MVFFFFFAQIRGKKKPTTVKFTYLFLLSLDFETQKVFPYNEVKVEFIFVFSYCLFGFIVQLGSWFICCLFFVDGARYGSNFILFFLKWLLSWPSTIYLRMSSLTQGFAMLSLSYIKSICISVQLCTFYSNPLIYCLEMHSNTLLIIDSITVCFNIC